MKKTQRTARIAAFCGCAALLASQLTAPAGTLVNRYSFNETSGTTSADSVSGQNGTLINGASFTGSGQAFLNNPTGTFSGDSSLPQYVSLPSDLVSNLQAFTFEIWVTPTLDDFTGGAFWARLWDFGNTGTNTDGSTFGATSFMYSRVGNSSFAPLADSFVASNGGDNWCYTAAIMQDSLENHWVWTGDPVAHIQHVYLNGILVGTGLGFNNSPVIVGATANDYLGRSQFSGDAALNGSIDEFRVYSGALDPLTVAADYQNGPDVYPASYGTLTGLQLQITSPIGLGNSAPSTVFAQASGLTNQIDLSLNAEIAIAFSSLKPSVATVDAAGNVTGVSSGSAGIVATYGGISTTNTIQVIALPTTMIHRYSFNDGTADDSIGTVNGSFYNTSGNASIANGQLNLVGSAGDYVDLGPGVITSTNIQNNAITFESWATFSPQNGAWTRLFDFGNIVGGTVGANYFFYAPNTGANGGSSRLAVSDASPGYLDETGFNVNNVLGNTNMHVVAVFNPNPSRQTLALYLNGQFITSVPTGNKTLASLNDQYSLIGRSLYSGSGDAWLNGSVDEFRIYNGELNRFQIAASFQAGPDHTNFDVGTFTGFALNPGVMPLAMSAQQSIGANMNFSAATNVNVAGDPNLTLVSSDTNVFTINPNGVITGVGVGTATLTAVYNYVVGATTNTYSGTTNITVFRDSKATLTHRYSFTTDASDSVGTANGTLNGAATVAGGSLVLPDGLAGTYCQLPPGIVTNDLACTVEAWATIYPGQNTWANLFDFGNQDAGGLAEFDIHVCVRGSGGDTIAGISDTDNANVNSQFVSLGAGSALDGRTNIHVVAVFDPPAGYIAIYENGAFSGSVTGVTIKMSGVHDVRNLIGVDNWPDPGMKGSIDEFRIYNGVLHADEIAATQALGTDQLLSTAPPRLTASVSGSSITLSWPLASAGFTPQSSSGLSSGTWTSISGAKIVGGQWQVTVPVSGSSGFFRVQR